MSIRAVGVSRSTRWSMRVAVAALVAAFVLVAESASGAPFGRPGSADLTVRSLSNPPASTEGGASFRSALTVANLGKRAARPAPRLRPVDGGPRYYDRFSNALPSRPSYFPIGVWLECAANRAAVRRDKDAGLNLYVAICGNAREWAHVVSGGMRVFPQSELLSRGVSFGAETAGWMNSDELDMTQGANGCQTVRNRNSMFPADRRLRYANFGKGVAVWLSDAQAACFLNAVDVPSTDVYWFSDDNICGAGEAGNKPGVVTANRCHVAANYGWLVSRERSLIQPARSKPVWAFVEVGCPFDSALALHHASADQGRRLAQPHRRGARNHLLQPLFRRAVPDPTRAAGAVLREHASDGQGDEQADQGARPCPQRSLRHVSVEA